MKIGDRVTVVEIKNSGNYRDVKLFTTYESAIDYVISKAVQCGAPRDIPFGHASEYIENQTGYTYHVTSRVINE